MKTPKRCGLLLIFCILIIGLLSSHAYAAAPPNDDIANAESLSGETGTWSGTNVDATEEIGEPSNHTPCKTIWFKWTAPSTTNYIFNTFGYLTDTDLAVYKYIGTGGITFSDIEFVNFNGDYDSNIWQSRLSFSAVSGTTYYIVIDSYGFGGCLHGTPTGPVGLNWGPESLVPANNDFNPLAIAETATSGTITGTNINATPEASEPKHFAGNAYAYSSIWYKWTATSTQLVVFDTFGSDFDTVLASYTGAALGSLNQEASNDDDSGGPQSRIIFQPTVVPTTYYIAVDGSDGRQGDTVLNWQTIPSLPPNDDFSAATLLTGASGTESAYNFLATAETPDEPSHAGSGPTASIWFVWTATLTSLFTFDTFGSDFDTTIAVYTGTAVDSLSLEAGNNDAAAGVQSSVTFSAVSGTTYHIAVDGYGGDEGNVVLNWEVPTYTLTYLAGAHGSISGTTPQTVDHGSDGSEVTAVPETGYHFVNWDDLSTDNPRQDTNVTGDITVTASFAINSYNLNYTAGANGYLTGSTSQTVNYGDDGTAVTANPGPNFHFVNWSDGSTDNPRTDTNVQADVDVTANFAIDTHILTYLAGAHGSISGTTPQTINHASSGQPVTAVPDIGYHFVNWSDGSTDNPRTDTFVLTDINVTASFAVNTYSLSITLEGTGTGTVTSDQGGITCPNSCSDLYDHGTLVTLTATPQNNSRFAGWSGDCSGTNLTCEVTVNKAINVTAEFNYSFPWPMFLPAITNNALTP